MEGPGCAVYFSSSNSHSHSKRQTGKESFFRGTRHPSSSKRMQGKRASPDKVLSGVANLLPENDRFAACFQGHLTVQDGSPCVKSLMGPFFFRIVWAVKGLQMGVQ